MEPSAVVGSGSGAPLEDDGSGLFSRPRVCPPSPGLPGLVSLMPKSAASVVLDAVCYVLAATLRILLEEGNANVLLL